ncbi:chromate transporter [Clostridium senegalense]|uniref:chromate transporter n=1 Tax=Clostridium senegalense TaxID=1465809 RepID=UPI001C12421A|nr:chromate transporter [Clostridium senegalense]MBU5225797.1 chromate transporter [Clostridium senegalense]
MVLLKLYLAFLKVGTFGFGGGYAILSLIENEVVNSNKWISATEFVDIIGISQMTPGPVAINCATFTGYKVSGVLGSIVATLGVVTTSFILVTLAYFFFTKFKESTLLNSALSGMKPALIGLIIGVFISLSKTAYVDFKSLIIGAIIGVMLFKTKIHPILIIVISAVLGIVFY